MKRSIQLFSTLLILFSASNSLFAQLHTYDQLEQIIHMEEFKNCDSLKTLIESDIPYKAPRYIYSTDFDYENKIPFPISSDSKFLLSKTEMLGLIRYDPELKFKFWTITHYLLNDNNDTLGSITATQLLSHEDLINFKFVDIFDQLDLEKLSNYETRGFTLSRTLLNSNQQKKGSVIENPRWLNEIKTAKFGNYSPADVRISTRLCRSLSYSHTPIRMCYSKESVYACFTKPFVYQPPLLIAQTKLASYTYHYKVELKAKMKAALQAKPIYNKNPEEVADFICENILDPVNSIEIDDKVSYLDKKKYFDSEAEDYYTLFKLIAKFVNFDLDTVTNSHGYTLYTYTARNNSHYGTYFLAKNEINSCACKDDFDKTAFYYSLKYRNDYNNKLVDYNQLSISEKVFEELVDGCKTEDSEEFLKDDLILAVENSSTLQALLLIDIIDDVSIINEHWENKVIYTTQSYWKKRLREEGVTVKIKKK